MPLLLLAALLLVPASAGARESHPDLWVTVNRCDGRFSQDRMGLRASVPGNGTRDRIYVRFRAQYFDTVARRWQNVFGLLGRSPRYRLGDARVRARQAGFTFAFYPPLAGGQFVLRGVAEFQYRRFRTRKGRKPRLEIVKRLRVVSRSGIKNVRGGDPPGRSRSICVIR